MILKKFTILQLKPQYKVPYAWSMHKIWYQELRNVLYLKNNLSLENPSFLEICNAVSGIRTPSFSNFSPSIDEALEAMLMAAMDLSEVP